MSYTNKQGKIFLQVQPRRYRNRLSALLTTGKYTIPSGSSNDENFSHQNKGFSMIELVVTIFIVGILSAIALSIFLRLVNQAREIEAKTTVWDMLNRQKEYTLEHNRFADELEIMPPSETKNYRYSVFSENTSLNGSVMLGLSKKPYLKSYAAVLFNKDGKINSCSQIPLNINQTTPPLLIIPQINDVIANSEKYC